MLAFRAFNGRALVRGGVFLFLSISSGAVLAAQRPSPALAQKPPMGWNDWAHYRCGLSAQVVLENAKALAHSGLAARGYNTVTIDDCWMQKTRDSDGNLQVDTQRFPQGMAPVANAVHALGLKFGIYEDAGYKTCGGYAGSGEPDGGGKDHFLQDARLFASWGVDYLKLDGCNMYVPKGGSELAAYRKAYAAESVALKSVGRNIVFSESVPAYFLDTPDWYDVLQWVGTYGHLWREGWDIETFKPETPTTSRFHSVLWNYAYNLPLGRFQKPGNWNDADFIIGGDQGMTLPETRSQMALWAMMSAPLILSSDVAHLSAESLGVIGNQAIIAVDQDRLGRMATLVRRNPVMDILFKTLSDGDYAVAVLNRGSTPLAVDASPSDLGFAANEACELRGSGLWSGERLRVKSLKATVASHDTEIWRIHPSSACGAPSRTGAITMIVNSSRHDIDSYSRCLSSAGQAGHCNGVPADTWTVTPDGSLRSEGRCLGVANGSPSMQSCTGVPEQRWIYTPSGNLVNRSDRSCLSSTLVNAEPGAWTATACGHNQPNQIWSLPN